MFVSNWNVSLTEPNVAQKTVEFIISPQNTHGSLRFKTTERKLPLKVKTGESMSDVQRFSCIRTLECMSDLQKNTGMYV